MPGTTKLHRLEENLAGANIEFTAGELDDLTTTASQLQVVGDRLPQRMLEPTEQ
jgi:aryl-alcohol dehydrogenase-like predicted oxidoreductase